MEPLDKIYLIPRGQDRRETWWLATRPQAGNFETFVKDGVPPAYVRELEAVVSEAVEILSGLLVQDDAGLVFVSSVDGKIIERAVAFVAAAKGE